jgi:fumarylacetoacetate (FAA) hydrolase family protein
MIEHLPSDWRQAILVGRILTHEGPTPVVVVDGHVRDVSRHAPTVSQLLNGWNGEIPAGTDLGPLESFHFTRCFQDRKDVRLLSPFDLQCIKASGVTFAISAMERVIEERCRGDASKADSLRASLRDRIGTDIRSVKPGSEDARKLKQALISDGLWSQYLEVAIGRTRRSSPRPRRCHRWVGESSSACAPTPPGTTPNPRSCSR